MTEMNPVLELGLPSLTEEDIEVLAQDCEEAVTQRLFSLVPEKSISDLAVSCTLDLNPDGQLDLDIEIVLEQQYDTGHDFDAIAGQATEYGSEWLEQRLMERKTG